MPMYLPREKIQDYAIIGDCRSVGVVGRSGSLDWLCWPQFDSPPIFAALLDQARGGNWLIAPVQPHKTVRRYVPDTNILETLFELETGTVVLTDLMPVASEEYKRQRLTAEHEVLRQIECIRGEVEIHVVFQPTSNYGARKVPIRPAGKCGLRMEAGRGVYWLRSSHSLTVCETGAVARLHLKSGETAQFSLSYATGAPAVLPVLGAAAQERVRISLEWWQNWAARTQYEGPYRDVIIRSALVL